MDTFLAAADDHTTRSVTLGVLFGCGFFAPQTRTCPRREVLHEADDRSFGNFHLFRLSRSKTPFGLP
jgi:hypothetical protein